MSVFAQATFDYVSRDPGDLSFREGDVVEVLKKEGDWWVGRSREGLEGYFPYNRVKIIQESRVSSFIDPVSDFKHLSKRSDNEVVSDVRVEHDGSRKRRELPYFFVEVKLKSGEVLEDAKTSADFRNLEEVYKMLIPGYSFSFHLPPQWGDNLVLNEEMGEKRAMVLTNFLTKNKKSKELIDMAMIYWMKSNRDEMAEKKELKDCQVKATDSKKEIEKKIKGAFAFECKKVAKNPLEYFLGPNKLGQLSQGNFKWEARDDTEVSFAAGDYVLITKEKTEFKGWWLGERLDGSKGFFPFNYVLVLKDDSVKRRIAKSVPKGKFGMKSQDTGKSTGEGGGINRMNTLASSAITKNVQGTGPSRERKIEAKFLVKSITAYDELKFMGFTLEKDGKHVVARHTGEVQVGDHVTLSYSAFTWNPQTQMLKEFSASEKLRAPPRGVDSGVAGTSGSKMEFVVGKNDAIEGLEEVVQFIGKNEPVRVILNPSMGYGDIGSPPEIPANCFLVYDLVLEDVKADGSFAPPPVERFSVGITRNKIQKREAMFSGSQWASTRNV